MTQTSHSASPGGTWVAADPHFGHANILNFESSPGVPLRPFKDVEEMDETMISNWNSVVKDQDRVYLLGDVAFHPRVFQRVIPRLAGRIVLVLGNHDPVKLRRYGDLFDDVRGYICKKGFIMSHIPIHPGSISRWAINIHGHTHSNLVGKIAPWDTAVSTKDPDPRYVCVSMEQIDYTPKSLSDILKESNVFNTDREPLGSGHRGGQPSR